MNLRQSLVFRSAFVALFLAAGMVSAAEHVRNRDFAEGTRFWNVSSPTGMLQAEQKGAVLMLADDAVSLNVEALPKEGRGVPADVRLWQKVTSLESGRAYRLSFEARTVAGGAPGVVNVRFGKSTKLADGTHNTVGGLPISPFQLTENWAPFSYEFIFNGDKSLELPKDLEACWLVFAVGTVKGFELRSASVTEVN